MSCTQFRRLSCTPSSRATGWRCCAERPGGVLSQEGCWSKPAWEQGYGQSWERDPLKCLRRARVFGDSCTHLRCMQVDTDAIRHLVVAQCPVHSMCNTVPSMAHRWSIVSLPGFDVCTEDGAHAAHVDVRPRRVHMRRPPILKHRLGHERHISHKKFGEKLCEQSRATSQHHRCRLARTQQHKSVMWCGPACLISPGVRENFPTTFCIFKDPPNSSSSTSIIF